MENTRWVIVTVVIVVTLLILPLVLSSITEKTEAETVTEKTEVAEITRTGGERTEKLFRSGVITMIRQQQPEDLLRRLYQRERGGLGSSSDFDPNGAEHFKRPLDRFPLLILALGYIHWPEAAWRIVLDGDKTRLINQRSPTAVRLHPGPYKSIDDFDPQKAEEIVKILLAIGADPDYYSPTLMEFHGVGTPRELADILQKDGFYLRRIIQLFDEH